jgi:hypothetical protein
MVLVYGLSGKEDRASLSVSCMSFCLQYCWSSSSATSAKQQTPLGTCYGSLVSLAVEVGIVDGEFSNRSLQLASK